MLFRIGRWEIECDPDTTAACYSQLPLGSGCDCLYCRNFLAALDSAFPAQWAALLHSLGIDIRKPAELAHYCREDSGLFVTGGWFHLVGEILAGADAQVPVGDNAWTSAFERLTGETEFGFTNRLDLVRDPFKGRRLIQLDFLTRVPWVIDAPEPE
jgi:hypothetical protein